MTVQLIPVLEIVYSDQGISMPDKYPYWENTNAWNKYYQDNYFKAGFVDLQKPYAAGSPFYKLVDISDTDLIKLVEDHTKDLRNGKYNSEEAAALSGGFVLNVNGQDKFFPQCCGELNDIAYWQKVADGNAKAYYEGHPAPAIKINDDTITFDFSVDEFDEAFQPTPPNTILRVDLHSLKEAVVKAKEELKTFSERLQQINNKEQLNIIDIDNLLIWDNPNQE